MTDNNCIAYISIEQIKTDIWDSIEELKKARKQNGWSIAELSKRSGVSVGVISDLENNKGKVPSLANFIALTRILNMPKDFVAYNVFKYQPPEKHKDPFNIILRDDLNLHGIHDEDSINFILQTIEFLKDRKKNTIYK